MRWYKSWRFLGILRVILCNTLEVLDNKENILGESLIEINQKFIGNILICEIINRLVIRDFHH